MPAKSSIYPFSMSLLPACVAMTQRGLRVDEALRQERLAALTSAAAEQRAAVEPLISEIASKLSATRLYWKHKVCTSCRNGSKKRQTCAACGGIGKFSAFVFNLGSEKQLKDVLYNGLKLPKRTRDGKLVSDEEALQSLVALDTSGFVQSALRFAKLDTMRGIYARLAPAPDAHIRTVFNPAGTYNGRFNSSEAFYVPYSTNLQNLPNESEGRRDPLYAVRDCIIPEPGEVFLYADLSAADQWSVAALTEDEHYFDLLRQGRAHSATGAAIFSCPERDVVKGSPRYFVAKTGNHAVCFGEGAKTLMHSINKESDITGFSITLAGAKGALKAIHTFRPKIDNIWWKRVEENLRGPARLRNAWGRECQFYPRTDWQTGEPDDETMRAMVAWEPASNTVDTLNGAPHTEPKRSCGMLGLFHREAGNGFRLLFQGHDSVLLGVDKHRMRHVARLAKSLLEREITVNGYTFVIPAEVFVGAENWGNLERGL